MLEIDNRDVATMGLVYAIPATIATVAAFIVYGINELSVVLGIFDLIFWVTPCVALVEWLQKRHANRKK